MAAAPYIVRAPEHDSAAIESHRLGGNFAFGVATAEAFAKVTPQLATVTHPVAETTYINEPAPIAHVQPAPIEHTHYAAQPILRDEAILAQEPVIGPIGTTTRVHQPIFKTLQYTQTAPVAVAQAGYAIEGYAAAAPIAAAPIAAAGYGGIAIEGLAGAPIAAAGYGGIAIEGLAGAPIAASGYALAAPAVAVEAAPAVAIEAAPAEAAPAEAAPAAPAAPAAAAAPAAEAAPAATAA